MFYEDVKMIRGETVSGLAVDYGYKASDWKKIWNDPKNKPLVTKRIRPENLQVGDVLMIKIPWKVISKSITIEPRGVGLIIKRDGEKGTRLRWVQTIYQHNQPVAGTNIFAVDACPPDDNKPYYWTHGELTADPTCRKIFKDSPTRNPPSASAGSTYWRAVLSIAVVTGKKVTVFESLVWGFDMTSAGKVSKVVPRTATFNEVSGHINLLHGGKGTGPDTFKSQGYSFRKP